ncbi:MAG: transposase [Candidatus Omnitrophota bacterium]
MIQYMQTQSYQRTEKNRLDYRRGISTRDVAGALKPLLNTTLSASVVSRITKRLNPLVKEFHQRKLLDEYQFLFLDGITMSIIG